MGSGTGRKAKGEGFRSQEPPRGMLLGSGRARAEGVLLSGQIQDGWPPFESNAYGVSRTEVRS